MVFGLQFSVFGLKEKGAPLIGVTMAVLMAGETPALRLLVFNLETRN
jgi:hypothetical protein